MISVAHTGENRDQALVRLTAQVVAGVRPEAALLRRLLILNGRLRFGAFAYEPDGDLILFTHSLLGGATLNPNEVMAAVHDVALAADRYDDQIVAQYGGRRMQDVIEESAWARLLKKSRRRATASAPGRRSRQKTPSSGGKKKGSSHGQTKQATASGKPPVATEEANIDSPRKLMHGAVPDVTHAIGGTPIVQLSKSRPMSAAASTSSAST